MTVDSKPDKKFHYKHLYFFCSGIAKSQMFPFVVLGILFVSRTKQNKKKYFVRKFSKECDT